MRVSFPSLVTFFLLSKVIFISFVFIGSVEALCFFSLYVMFISILTSILNLVELRYLLFKLYIKTCSKCSVEAPSGTSLLLTYSN